MLELSDDSTLLLQKALKLPKGKDAFTPQKQIEQLIRHRIGSHFMQKAFQYASPEIFSHLYTVYLRKKMVDLCRDNNANWVVQQCIASVSDPAQVEMIFDELEPSIPSLFG
jgi:hypothetical protein